MKIPCAPVNFELDSESMGWKNLITVEPAMFLQQAGDTLTYVIFQNLFIEKVSLENDYRKIHKSLSRLNSFS